MARQGCSCDVTGTPAVLLTLLDSSSLLDTPPLPLHAVHSTQLSAAQGQRVRNCTAALAKHRRHPHPTSQAV